VDMKKGRHCAAPLLFLQDRPARASSVSRCGGACAPAPSKTEWLYRPVCMLTRWGRERAVWCDCSIAHGQPRYQLCRDERAMCHSVGMRRYPKYQNRYQRRRAKRLARRKGNQPQHVGQRVNTRGALWLRLVARLVRVLR
jgi:hypothetical protein